MVNAKVKFIKYILIKLHDFNSKLLIKMNVKYLVTWEIKGSRMIYIQICVTATANAKNEATY